MNLLKDKSVDLIEIRLPSPLTELVRDYIWEKIISMSI